MHVFYLLSICNILSPIKTNSTLGALLKNTQAIGSKSMKNINLRFPLLVGLMLFVGCQPPQGSGKEEHMTQTLDAQALETLRVTSPAFSEGAEIPQKYTCDGENVSPPLHLEEVDKNTKSLVLIMEDPDAPMGTWTHWLVWNLPPSLKHLRENALPDDAIQGLNSFQQLNYGGPCPPSGVHRYFFKVYALDILLYLETGASRHDLEQAMEDHVLGWGSLMGRYQHP